MSSPRPDEAVIREQAYYFWEQDGRPDGRETEYWMRATIALSTKQQVEALTKSPPKDAAKPKLETPRLKAAASKAEAPPVKSAKATPKAKKK